MEEIKIYSTFDYLIHPQTQQAIRQAVANIGGIDAVNVSKTLYGSDEYGLNVYDGDDNYMFSIQNGETSIYEA